MTTPKVKHLWNKGSTNDWQPNIDALVGWKYLSDDLAKNYPKSTTSVAATCTLVTHQQSQPIHCGL